MAVVNKDYTSQRELDNRVYAVAKKLAAHGIMTEFVYKNDGTCKSELTVTNVNGKSIKKRIKIKKNSDKGDYTWVDRSNEIEKFGVDNNHIYVLIDEFDQLHIVPSKSYRVAVEIGHYEYTYNSFGKNGQRRADGNVRHFYDTHNDFLNAFEFFSI